MEDVILKDVEILIIIVFDGILGINGDGFYLLEFFILNKSLRYVFFILKYWISVYFKVFWYVLYLLIVWFLDI